MLDFLRKKETWKATFKNITSAYSYAKKGDYILVTEADITETKFRLKAEEYTYKLRIEFAGQPECVGGTWQVLFQKIGT